MPVLAALDYVRQAAGHPLLGADSLYDGVVSPGASTTIFSSGALVTYTNDTRYRQHYVQFWAGGAAGDQRRIYSMNGALGQLQVLQPLTAAPASGDPFLLLRDLPYAGPQAPNWLDILNDTCRSLYFDQETYVRGITDLYRYTLPTPVSFGGWIHDVFIAPYPTRWSDAPYEGVEWFRVNPLNISGDVALVLDEWLNADQQLLFLHDMPYGHPGLSAFTMTRSVLTPFGSSTAITPPADLLIAGMVWRALKIKTRNATGGTRALWLQNLAEAAQYYAAKCAEHKLRRIGLTQGWRQRW